MYGSPMHFNGCTGKPHLKSKTSNQPGGPGCMIVKISAMGQVRIIASLNLAP